MPISTAARYPCHRSIAYKCGNPYSEIHVDAVRYFATGPQRNHLPWQPSILGRVVISSSPPETRDLLDPDTDARPFYFNNLLTYT